MASNKEQKLKVAIVVLSVLLAISLTALAGLVYYYGRIAPTVVPDNIITTGKLNAAVKETDSETGAYIVARDTEILAMAKDAEHASEEGTLWSSNDQEILKLFEGQDYDLTSFAVKNMFPGDALYKEYNVQVSHRGTVVVHFTADVHPTSDPEGSKLEEVLMCRIEVGGEVLYDGLMRDIPESIDYITPNAARAVTTELIYTITAYLDGPSVGNNHMNKSLVADFQWWVEVEKEEETESTPEDTSPEETTPEETTPEETTPEETSPAPGGGDDDDDDEVEKTTTAHEPEETTKTEIIGDGELVKPPKTGDTTIWVFVATLISVFFLIILLIGRRRKEEEDEQ